MIKKIFLVACLSLLLSGYCSAQHSDESANIKKLRFYQDSLNVLGKKFINNESAVERKNAGYEFIKTLVTALKVPNSFLFPFDSVKSVTIINSPDNTFRIISWHIIDQNGIYRFYGTVQLNTGGNLKMYPLEDYSPMFRNPEDSVTNNQKWFGAQYYKIIPVYSPKVYYVLLGWKGNNDQSTKKVIDVITFKNNMPELGLPVFDGNGKTRKRVVFEYTRQASMLLKYVPEQNLIVFDHLAPPDPRHKSEPHSFGPDLSYDGYKQKNGRWVYVDNLDMRNVPDNHDSQYTDPKKQAEIDRATKEK